MNINKRLGRVKQWAGEKIGSEARSNISEDIKTGEVEMQLRQDAYVKSLSKTKEMEDREKMVPASYLGATMINHGEDFEPDSEFGNCLIAMGRTSEKVGGHQEAYVQSATTGWLQSLERSLAMMKEYQTARKKLEGRRLAYDASLSKTQKAKKEDFRVEEELRSQKAKYEESSEDVLRRMQDIKDAEAESIADLGAFVDAQLEYFDSCRDELLKLKRDWPAGSTSPQRDQRRPNPRSRSNTHERFTVRDSPPPEPEARPAIRSQRVASREPTHHQQNEYIESPRPTYGRSVTSTSTISNFQAPTSTNEVGGLRAQLRPTTKINTANMNSDTFGDPSDHSTLDSASPDRSYGARSVSPATSHGSQNTNYSIGTNRKGPPPPPPRTKKPPPPPPMKRAAASDVFPGRY
ncbi:hypothetical protein B7494_g894 [Chlorociboria aeruginascens]|nr:hypothetical protein B7494_g894 [Chlorociboria aeruginascens]